MRAVRYYGQKDIRVEDIPEPQAGPGEVLINVGWCGICGTDLHEYLEGPIFVPAPGHPHPISGEDAPVTLGHEFSGTVAALGEGVTDLEVGQKVVVEPYILPDDVDPKEDGPYNLHPDMNFIGLGVEPSGRFLHDIRRVTTRAEFFRTCEEFLAHDEPMPMEPFPIAMKEHDVLAGAHL